MPLSNPPTPPRTAKLPTAAVTWSDGTLFDGYGLFGLVNPTDGVTPWAEADYGSVTPGLQLPTWQLIPIAAGQWNVSCGLYFNADIKPPFTKYVYFIYDASRRQISGPSTLFTVTASPAVLPALSITAPSQSGPIPTPDS